MSDMVGTHEELGEALRQALMEDRGGVFDALYDAEGVEGEDRRVLVATMRDETKSMFAQAREQLNGAAVELVAGSVVVDGGGRWSARFVVAGGPTLEIVVDDLHERGGGLRTRDAVQINAV